MKRNSQLHYFTKGTTRSDESWRSKIQLNLSLTLTMGPLAKVYHVFSGQPLWCCRSLYCIDSSPLMTLAVELNKSGSSWPMNRTAEETCEKEQPLTLLYERGNSIRLILKVQNTVKYIPCSTNGPISPSISDIFFWDFCDVVDLFTIEDRVPFWP